MIKLFLKWLRRHDLDPSYLAENCGAHNENLLAKIRREKKKVKK